MPSRYGERSTSGMAATTPPPSGRDSAARCSTDAELGCSAFQAISRWMHRTAIPMRAGGQEQQARRPERTRERRGQRRSDERPGRAARGDEAEEPLRLRVREEIGHEAPEHRHHEQVVDARPDEEGAGRIHVAALGAEQCVEDEEVRDEEAVDVRQEAVAREPRGHPPEERHRGEHREEGTGEQPVELLHPGRDAHRVAHRPHDVVAAEEREEIREGPEQRGQLVRLDLHQARQPDVERAPGGTGGLGHSRVVLQGAGALAGRLIRRARASKRCGWSAIQWSSRDRANRLPAARPSAASEGSTARTRRIPDAPLAPRHR